MAIPLKIGFSGTHILLKYCHGVLSPSPFSRLLATTLGNDLAGNALAINRAIDLGSGSGIQGILLAKLGVHEVYSVDIDSRCVAATEFNALLNGVSEWASASNIVYAHLGDLFDPLGNVKADLIVCNPPSLPMSDETPRFACGGRYPQEFLDRLIASSCEMLTDQGNLVFVISSLVGLRRTQGKLAEYGFEHKILSRKTEKFREFYYPHISYYRRSQLEGVANFRSLPNGELEETLYVIKATRTRPVNG